MAGSLRASAQGLEIVDQARKRQGWTKTMTVAWWQSALTSQATLRRFWRKLPIQQETFIKICEAVGISNWKQIVDGSLAEEPEAREMAIADWGEAPDVCGFYGRTEELTQLEQWIVNDRCRLVTLLGMGGIGKTALSVMLAEQIQNKFDYFIWRSLAASPSVEDLLAQLIRFFSNGQVTNLPNDFGQAVSQLMKYMHLSRCLVILDEVETILRPGEPAGYYREGYEGYGELIRRVGRERHNSCLMLISREPVNEIALMQEETVQSLLLSDLNNAAAWQIFRDKGLLDENKWNQLLQIYKGNPLVLNIISGYIKNSFTGRVSDFLRLETIVLGDIHLILDGSWQRLSSLQREVMFQLTTAPILLLAPTLNRRAVSKSEILEAIQALERRSLIEKQLKDEEVIYTLQPIVKKYVMRKFN